MDIEEVASSSPEKIITTKIEINDEISNEDCENIIKIFNLSDDTKNQAISLIKSKNWVKLLGVVLFVLINSGYVKTNEIPLLSTPDLLAHSAQILWLKVKVRWIILVSIASSKGVTE